VISIILVLIRGILDLSWILRYFDCRFLRLSTFFSVFVASFSLSCILRFLSFYPFFSLFPSLFIPYSCRARSTFFPRFSFVSATVVRFVGFSTFFLVLSPFPSLCFVFFFPSSLCFFGYFNARCFAVPCS